MLNLREDIVSEFEEASFTRRYYGDKGEGLTYTKKLGGASVNINLPRLLQQATRTWNATKYREPAKRDLTSIWARDAAKRRAKTQDKLLAAERHCAYCSKKMVLTVHSMHRKKFCNTRCKDKKRTQDNAT